MKFLLFCFLPFLSFMSIDSMGQDKPNISSWIEKDIEKQELRFTAYFRNETGDNIKELSYEFSGTQNSPAGDSNVKQSGKFKAEPGKKITLATISFGKGENDKKNIVCVLKIYKNNSLVCTDTLDIMV